MRGVLCTVYGVWCRIEPGRAAMRRGRGLGGAAGVGPDGAALHAAAAAGAGGAARHGALAALDRPGLRVQADRPGGHRRDQRLPGLCEH